MKKIILILTIILVLNVNILNSNAQVIQTKEGKTSIELSWNDKTDTNYQIGYAEYYYDMDYIDGALAKAKKMANKGKIKLSKNKRTYKLKKLNKNTNYIIILRYTKNGKIKYSINSHVYTKMSDNITVNLDNRFSYMNEAVLIWDIIPGADYEVKITDENGNIDYFKGKNRIKTFLLYYNAKPGMTYKVQVRAVRKSPKKYSKIPKKYSKWSKEFIFIK